MISEIPTYYGCPECSFEDSEVFMIQIHLQEEHSFNKQVKTYTSDELVEKTNVDEYHKICRYD